MRGVISLGICEEITTKDTKSHEGNLMENTCLRATEDDRTLQLLSDPSAESVKDPCMREENMYF